MDAWHADHTGAPADPAAYEAFLREIGYLVEAPAPFAISPTRVDDEVARLGGPQLVVPVLNARFLLNAANARGAACTTRSTGPTPFPGAPAGRGYDPERGAAVIAWAKAFLDRAAPLAEGSWADFGGGAPVLADPAQLVGRRGESLLLRHNGLHIEVVVDREHPIGRTDPAGIADVALEAALSTIVDLEDSVAAVDAQDKAAAYANWLGLMKGDLAATFEKGGQSLTRTLEPDRSYTAPDGSTLTVPGRSLLLVRNVGHLMTTPAIRLPDGAEAPEGILDAAVTSLIALHDLQGRGPVRNSRAGSIYIVKPKMHGPEEAAFTDRLFDAVEDLLGLSRHTLKVGVMDEERRTSANLAACIAAVKDRIIFINTGFLDRTGDEMHTAMRAGPMIRKGEMKASDWIAAYEDRNVQIGLACGFSGQAQIGKGMWAAPRPHGRHAGPEGGPSAERRQYGLGPLSHGRRPARHPLPRGGRVRPPARAVGGAGGAPGPAAHRAAGSGPQLVGGGGARRAGEQRPGHTGLRRALDRPGIGCSKVPDIHDVGLMEDRATLRISSQHIANWLLHGVASRDEVEQAFRRMAAKVDAQNAADPLYQPMAGREDASLAYQAARALVFEGIEQPNGYTEPLLHRYRLQVVGAR